ncbi:MAG: hypothetical protein ACXABO_13375 [Promethearchaeota archaeon]|jgi:hypothetical protein
MTQAYKKVVEIEFEEIEYPEVKISIESEVDELIGDLNPRFFEEASSLKEAKDRIQTSDITFSSNFNVFRTF